MSDLLSQNELMTLLFGVVGAAFMLLNWALLRRLPRPSLLSAAYLLLVGAWAAANAGNLLWASALGLLEHCCYLASSVLLALWCWTALRAPQGARP